MPPITPPSNNKNKDYKAHSPVTPGRYTLAQTDVVQLYLAWMQSIPIFAEYCLIILKKEGNIKEEYC